MGAKIGNFFATLLLSIPLAAMGLMAIFGVPRLVPAVAGPDEQGIVRSQRDALPWGELPPDRNVVESFATEAPAYGSYQTAPSSVPVNGTPATLAVNSQPAAFPPASPVTDQTPAPRHWSQSWTMASEQQSESVPTNPPSNLSPSPAPVKAVSNPFNGNSNTTGGLSWRDASLRLAEMGIRNFHLERGTSDGTFLFVCVYSPGDAPNVTHRFESEADDPLLAVNQVLQQVDGWMRSRFANANFPVRPSSLSLSTGMQSR